MNRASLLSSAVVAILLLATLGEGGATPTALFLLHGAITIVLLVLLLAPREADVRLPAPGPLTAYLAFVALACAGAAASSYAFSAWLVLLEQATFLAMGVVAARSGLVVADLAARALVWGAAVQGGLAIYQRVFLGMPRPAGTFLNPNHLAAWLVACLVLGLVHRGRLRVVAAIPAVVGLFLTGSRGALLALVAGFAVLILAGRETGSVTRRRGVLAVATILAIVATIGVAARVRAGGDPFPFHRTRIWRASLAAAWSHPWMGTGAGQFEVAASNLNFPLDGAPLRYERAFASPHSDVLRLPCEFGWPATVALVVALLLFVRHVRRRSEPSPAAATAGLAALAGLLAQAAVDDLTDRPALYLLAAVLVGSLVSQGSSPAPTRSRLPLRIVASVLVASIFVLGEAAPYLAWRVSQGLPRGRLSVEDRRRLDLALTRNPFHPDFWMRRAEDLAGDGRDWDVATYARSREAAEHAVRLGPVNARHWVGLARVEALACATLYGDESTRERAAGAYRRAEELARHDPFVPLELGRFLLETGDAPGARRAAHRALAIEPNAVPARLLLASILLAEGERGAGMRASELLREAEDTARRFEARSLESPYARALLGLDAAWSTGIKRRLVDSVPSSP